MRPNPKIIGGSLAAVVAVSMAFIKPWEGVRHVAYSDVVGITTACTGHTGPEVILGKYYDEYQCDAWFKRDITIAASGVASCVNRAPLTVNQAAAFTSLTFNIGV
ncbi:GH24 family phage-related lysozyme (muramidase) [Luteibacter sp. Sphag1AF]|nr:GH24 family phage-related lysozyme (muramidase) [Luteibacter sp. Sphag1AF]